MTPEIQKLINDGRWQDIADALEVAEDALRDIASVTGDEPQGCEYWAERMSQRATKALAEIQAIAERKE